MNCLQLSTAASNGIRHSAKRIADVPNAVEFFELLMKVVFSDEACEAAAAPL